MKERATGKAFACKVVNTSLGPDGFKDLNLPRIKAKREAKNHEGELWAQLDHPNIIPLLRILNDGGNLTCECAVDGIAGMLRPEHFRRFYHANCDRRLDLEDHYRDKSKACA